MAGPPQKAVLDNTNLANSFIVDTATLHLALLGPEEHRLGTRFQRPSVVDGTDTGPRNDFGAIRLPDTGSRRRFGRGVSRRPLCGHRLSSGVRAVA